MKNIVKKESFVKKIGATLVLTFLLGISAEAGDCWTKEQVEQCINEAKEALRIANNKAQQDFEDCIDCKCNPTFYACWKQREIDRADNLNAFKKQKEACESKLCE